MTTATEEKKDVKVVEMEGVRHLENNLYRVRLDLIELPKEPNFEKTTLEPFNPRYSTDNEGKFIAEGLSKEEMDSLYEAIKTEGLENPLLLRYAEDKLYLVSGDRRKRTLDKMVKKNDKVYNPATGELEPARNVYEYVDARINIMDIKQALKHAVSGNSTAIDIGEGAKVNLVKHLRQCKCSDAEIIEITGMGEGWLRDTDKMLEKLDPKTYNAFVNGEIIRKVALALSTVEDPTERLERLEWAKQAASERISKLKMKLEGEIQKAKTKKELAEADAADAKSRGDDKGAQEAEEEAGKAGESIKKKTEKKEKLSGKKPQAKSLDLGEGPKPFTRVKISKSWYEPAKALIKSECLDEEGGEIGIDVEDARLVKLLCEQIEKGEADITKILKQHAKAKAKR